MANDKKHDSDEQEAKGGILGDAIKKVLTTGVSAAFMTEESIRSYLGDIKLPKELMKTLVDSAQKSKEEMMKRVGNEVIAIISKIDFVKEFARFAETHKFKISAEIDIVKKDDK